MSELVKDYPSYLDYPKPRKKQTNADKIRAMTDEELAMFIKDIVEMEFRHHGLIGIFESGGYWLDWLKQEVNENGT